MNREDVEHFAALLQARTGFVLGSERGYLLESRLAPVARREGAPSVAALLRTIRTRGDTQLETTAVEAMALTDTAFFRDRTPFLRLGREILPTLASARSGRALRLWSAGCSTGQEAYSLALLSELHPEMADVRLEVVGSDISVRSIEKAQSGVYTQFEVQRGLPIRLLVDHFECTEDMWRATPRLRAAVQWRPFNLLADPAELGAFDVILCRNVLSGFEPSQRAKVLERFAAILPDDGLLLLGAGETAEDVSDALIPAPGARGFYRPARIGQRAAA